MSDLNIKNFEQHLQAKQQKHRDTFCYVLEKCKNKMEIGLNRGHPGIYYEVPDFLIGKPLYKLNDCIKFIIFSLSERGFSIKFYFPRVLYVSWENINTSLKRVILPLPPPAPEEPKNDFKKLVKLNNNNKLTMNV